MEFKLAETKEQLEIYNDIWLPIWIDSGFELESYISPNIKRFLIQDNNEYIGTIEFMPYDFYSSDINRYGGFDKYKILEFKKVYEIDKITIKKEYRRLEVLKEIVCFIAEFSIEENVDYCVGLFNPRLYKVLKRFYKVPIISVTNIKETNQYSPGIIDIEANIKNNVELMNWIRNKKESTNSLYATSH